MKISINGKGRISMFLKWFFINFTNFKICKINKKPFCIIDFSSPISFFRILKHYNSPILSGTTGLKKKHFDLIIKKKNPIIYSPNFNIDFFNFISYFSKIEILEEVHNKKKIDSPSGTSIFINNILNISKFYSIRIKNFSGNHKLIFENFFNKTIFEHRSKNIGAFLKGIIKSIFFIIKKKYGYFSIKEIL
ncbi:dihydrodipicolinate reductase C-terminal domain-containing protein [Candidatus Vidania fulgoroideorum]